MLNPSDTTGVGVNAVLKLREACAIVFDTNDYCKIRGILVDLQKDNIAEKLKQLRQEIDNLKNGAHAIVISGGGADDAIPKASSSDSGINVWNLQNQPLGQTWILSQIENFCNNSSVNQVVQSKKKGVETLIKLIDEHSSYKPLRDLLGNVDACAYNADRLIGQPSCASISEIVTKLDTLIGQLPQQDSPSVTIFDLLGQFTTLLSGANQVLHGDNAQGGSTQQQGVIAATGQINAILENIKKISAELSCGKSEDDCNTQIGKLARELTSALTTLNEQLSKEDGVVKLASGIAKNVQDKLPDILDGIKDATQKVPQAISNIEAMLTDAMGESVVVNTLISVLENAYKDQDIAKNWQIHKKSILDAKANLQFLKISQKKPEVYVVCHQVYKGRNNKSDASDDAAFNQTFVKDLDELGKKLDQLVDEDSINKEGDSLWNTLEGLYNFRNAYYQRTAKNIAGFHKTGIGANEILDRAKNLTSRRNTFVFICFCASLSAVLGAAWIEQIDKMTLKGVLSAVFLFASVGLFVSVFSQVDKKTFYKVDNEEYGYGRAIFVAAISAAFCMSALCLGVARSFDIALPQIWSKCSNESLLIFCGLFVSCICACVFALITHLKQESPNTQISVHSTEQATCAVTPEQDIIA